MLTVGAGERVVVEGRGLLCGEEDIEAGAFERVGLADEDAAWWRIAVRSLLECDAATREAERFAVRLIPPETAVVTVIGRAPPVQRQVAADSQHDVVVERGGVPGIEAASEARMVAAWPTECSQATTVPADRASAVAEVGEGDEAGGGHDDARGGNGQRGRSRRVAVSLGRPERGNRDADVDVLVSEVNEQRQHGTADEQVRVDEDPPADRSEPDIGVEVREEQDGAGHRR